MPMVNAKEKVNASTSNSSPSNNDVAITALTETTVSSPIKANLEEIVVISESEDKVENLMEEMANEENAMVVVKNEKNAIEEEKNGENSTEEEKNKENAVEEEINEENEIEEENAREEENSKDKVRKSRKRSRRKKVAQGAPKTIAAKDKNKPESSDRKKASKKAESMGMIFMCSSKTKKDCYRYKVLGLPASKRDVVEKVYKGMRLFLFDFDMRLMYGIYKAAEPGGYNIEPKAFKSAFPSQVRFSVLEDCLPLAEEKFRQIIKDNYYTRSKFNCQLNSEQVKKLCKLFVATHKGSKSGKSSRSVRAERHTFIDQDRIRQRPRELDKERLAAFGRERQYHERPVIYEREVFASPVAPLPRVLPLPPPAPAPLYAYERTLDMEAYRREPVLEHRDLRLLDLETRRRDEIGHRDSYISYREPPYHDSVYSTGLPPEYHRPVGQPPEYHLVGPSTEYHSSAGLLPKYHHYQPGLLPKYHHHQPLYRY